MIEGHTNFPGWLDVHMRLDDAPHYKGSIHDEAVARARGYKGALIPGAFVYGHMSRLAVDAWGMIWAERGAMSARFRKPVYDHDNITVTAGPLEDDGLCARSPLTVRNGDGEDVASGWIALPHQSAIAPAPDTLQLLDLPDDPPAISAGTLPVGALLRSRERVLSAGDFRSSLAAFQERHPIYGKAGPVHSGMLMRIGMGDVNSNWKFPAAVVLVEAEVQHFQVVRPGQRIRTAGHVAETYQRKDRHYFVSDEILLADGVPAARIKRTQIYG